MFKFSKISDDPEIQQIQREIQDNFISQDKDGNVELKGNLTCVDLHADGESVYIGDFKLSAPKQSKYLKTSGARVKATTRITDSDSPYNLQPDTYKLFCNTDSGDITVNLTKGVTGREVTFYNTGTGDVTLVPNGTEEIDGSNSNYVFGQGVVTLTYEEQEGWW